MTLNNAYMADVYYTAKGYEEIPDQDAMRVFYVNAKTFGEAAEKVIDNFNAYEKFQTGPEGKYYGLNYHLNGVRVEKAV